MLPSLKDNAVAGYQSPVKTELLKGASLLPVLPFSTPYVNLVVLKTIILKYTKIKARKPGNIFSVV